MIRVKFYKNDSIRRCKITDASTFNDLLWTIKNIFGTNVENYDLQYRDEEGDWVFFSCDVEWEEAKEQYHEYGVEILKIRLIERQKNEDEKQKEIPVIEEGTRKNGGDAALKWAMKLNQNDEEVPLRLRRISKCSDHIYRLLKNQPIDEENEVEIELHLRQKPESKNEKDEVESVSPIPEPKIIEVSNESQKTEEFVCGPVEVEYFSDTDESETNSYTEGDESDAEAEIELPQVVPENQEPEKQEAKVDEVKEEMEKKEEKREERPEEEFTAEEYILFEMGFEDLEKNKMLLQKFNNDVHKVVAELLK